jgi:hypothetical protein
VPFDTVLAGLDEALTDAKSRLQLLERECHGMRSAVIGRAMVCGVRSGNPGPSAGWKSQFGVLHGLCSRTMRTCHIEACHAKEASR